MVYGVEDISKLEQPSDPHVELWQSPIWPYRRFDLHYNRILLGLGIIKLEYLPHRSRRRLCQPPWLLSRVFGR